MQMEVEEPYVNHGIDLDSETNGIDAIITQRSLNAIVKPETFEVLFTAARQAFATLVIYRMEPGSASRAVLCPVSERGRYAEHFRNIQRMKQQSGVGSPAGSVLILTIMLSFNCDSSKPMGYVPFCRYIHPVKLGHEIVYAFYCNQLREVALFVASGPEQESPIQAMIGRTGFTLSLTKVCSWCGRVAGGHKKCPCKKSSYCDADCQHSHWSLHRICCPCSSKSHT